ncbi:putative multidrug resistance protein [Sulfurospirillum diekertiae]|uniref:Multidrug resistance protein n=1 Tax=Sulfurospirillum diekertiae TaxID=1854492 RepID=A0A290HEG1_9BACT|nr:efflux transporter outer membrane subunit [Sulfurospirillum diekertiae]ATB69923.1 putative multidrug resistance protein [Sulfurospirillum diekertiae]
MIHCRKAFLIGLLTLLGITGCSLPLTNEETPQIAPINAYQTKETFKTTIAQWPNEHWWEAYQDAQLTQLIQEGLKNSPDIKAVSARVTQASAVMGIARSSLLPQVGVNASASREKESYNYLTPASVVPHNWNSYGLVSLNMSWELDFWGKNRAALAAATSEFEAMLADQAQAELILSSAIATSYATLAQLFAIRDNASASMDNKQKIVGLMQKRFDQGLENKAGISGVQEQYAQAVGTLQTIDEQIALSKNQMAALLGEGPDKGLSIQRPTLNVDTAYSLPKEMALNLLGRRPDIVSARLQVESRQSKIYQKKAAFYPNINLSALIGFQSLGLNNLTKTGSDIGAIGPALYLPIFSAGALESDLKSAKAAYEEAVANYDSTVVHALQDVADVGVSQKSLSEQIKTAQAGVNAATQSYNVSYQRHQQGLASYMDLLYAHDNVYMSQKNLITLETKSLILDIAMKRALGGGYLMVQQHHN